MHPVKAVAVAVAVAVAAAALELTHYPRMASPRERRGAPVPGIGCPDQAGGEPGTRSLTPPPTARHLTLRRTDGSSVLPNAEARAPADDELRGGDDLRAHLTAREGARVDVRVDDALLHQRPERIHRDRRPAVDRRDRGVGDRPRGDLL